MESVGFSGMPGSLTRVTLYPSVNPWLMVDHKIMEL